MNKYLIFVQEGDCFTPDHQEIDAWQILGFVEANSDVEAEKNLLDEYPYLLEVGYTDFFVVRLDDSETIWF